MGVDIKFPIGLMFTILGVLLLLYGILTMGNTEMYKISLDININLWMGIIMVIFGVFMLITSRMTKAAAKIAKEEIGQE